MCVSSFVFLGVYVCVLGVLFQIGHETLSRIVSPRECS